jgi:hypothetical protein
MKGMRNLPVGLRVLALVVGTRFVQLVPAQTPSAWAANPPFILPTSGYVGAIYTTTHNGLDIWTDQPASGPCGNDVRAPYPGTVKHIYRSTTGFNWNDAARGHPEANIVVLEHHGVPGAPQDPIYTIYLHMAIDMAIDNGSGGGAGTCIADQVWDKLALQDTVPAGYVIGRQGNLRLAGSQTTHLHFSVSRAHTSNDTIDPGPFLGLNVCQGRSDCRNLTGQPSVQVGSALLYSGQTENLTLSSNTEQDSIYFYANQGDRATIRMNRLAASPNLDRPFVVDSEHAL